MKKSYLALSLAAMVLIALNLRAPITTVGSVAHEIQAAWELSPAAFGALGSLPLGCFFIFALAAPFFARTRAMLAALICLCAGLLLRPAAGVGALFLGTCALSAAIAVLNVMMPSFIKRNFAARVPQMMALYSLLLSLSSLVGVFGHYFAPAVGVRSVLAGWFVLAFLALISFLPFAKNRRFRRGSGSLNAREFAMIFAEKKAWVITAFMGLQSCVFYTVINWFLVVLSARTGDARLSANLVVVFQVAAIFAAYFVPLQFAKQRAGAAVWLLHGVCACNIAGFTLLLSGCSNAYVLGAAALLFSVPVGGVFGVALSMIATKAATAKKTVYLSAMAQSVGYLIAAAGPWAFGALSGVKIGEISYGGSLVFMLAVSTLLWLVAIWSAKIEKI